MIVDSDLDGGISNVGGEALYGRATVHVIPDPATLAILLIGVACALIIRRRRALAVVALLALMSSQEANAGTVSFDPPEVFFDPANPVFIELDVTIAAETAPILGFDAIVASESLSLPSFRYSVAVLDKCLVPFLCPNPQPFPELGLYIGAFNPGGWSSPLAIGTLTVELRNLDPGSYDIIVDTELDGGFSNVNGEALYGRATVHVIPEPAALAFLVMGSVALCSFSRHRHWIVRLYYSPRVRWPS